MLVHTWQIIMPIKGGPTSKSRLLAAASGAEPFAGPDTTTPELATAIALDSLLATRAARGVSRVIAVLGEHADPERLQTEGVDIVRQPFHGLIDAIRAGIAAADPDRPCAILLADVPALTPTVLEDVLRTIEDVLDGDDDDAPRQVFVPDHAATGTVLLAARRPSELSPAFGPDSAWLHAQTGAVSLAGDWPGLRRDVDTVADLTAADELGLGRHTADVLSHDRTWPPTP